MEEPKYTPGPWTIYKGNEGHPVIHSPTNERNAGGGIIGIAQTKTVGSFEIEKANAHLIAASPDLLNACKWAEDALSEMSDLSYGEKDILFCIRIAIKKAEGAMI